MFVSENVTMIISYEGTLCNVPILICFPKKIVVQGNDFSCLSFPMVIQYP